MYNIQDRSCLSMYVFAKTPNSVSPLIFARKISPVEMCGTPTSAAKTAACVPFPAPGGPMKTMRTAQPRKPS